MRLLRIGDDGGFSLVEFADNIPAYAILSHMWGLDQDEVTFKDMIGGTGEGKLGYQKLTFCARQAARDGLNYVWVDTCCIDKSSSAELSESINSMFQWYRGSKKCYAYLSDVSSLGSGGNESSAHQAWISAFKLSRWFTRGWTLQELLAPESVDFFSVEGAHLSNRVSMAQEINEITGISIRALQGTPLSTFGVGERFSWTTKRKTKRVEDGAYSLLGIFDVSMSAIYGEGRKRAFVRLQKEIMESLKGEMLILPKSILTDDGDESQASCPSEIFENAITAFRVSLSSKEQEILEKFSTYREMLDSLRSKCERVGNDYDFPRMLAKIQDFSIAWDLCFRVMDILTPANLEAVGLAWGAVHLLFTLGMKHKIYLEKIVSMFQRIAWSLAAFEASLDTFTKHGKTGPDSRYSPTDFHHLRLHKALSNVCAEILQFCQDSCRIFRIRVDDVPARPETSELSWEPFDVRFSALLDRFRPYKQVFGWEVQLDESKLRELHYSKQAGQSELGEDVRRQIQQELEDLRLSNDRMELKITSQYNAMEKELRKRECEESSSKAIERNYVEMMNSKASDIVKWIDTPDYMQEFKKARKTRISNTGQYLLDDPTYKRWKLAKPPFHRNLSGCKDVEVSQILLVKGKPGFGKTVLSSLLIEDLQDIRMAPIANSSDHGSTFFYHFASERRNCCEPYHAFRAVLAQIVQRYRSHQDTLDRIAVLMESGNIDMLKASDEEVFAALLLLLAEFDHTVLVFDGVDECEEHTAFLELVRDLCVTTSTRVMLLGRPNVDLPTRFEHQSIHLHHSNLRDIKHFLKPQVHGWKERKLVPDETPPELIVDKLAARSEGVFLWARLMSQYLNRKALSPKERFEAIFEAAEFSGLHGIYKKILEILEQGYEKETANVQKIFGLVATTFRPLLVTELRAAVAITPGKVTEASSFIAEFEESLPIICGALVEVQHDATVRFVHSSFRDFLASGSSQESKFSLNERTTHVRCSTICLSYLLYDLPSSTLSPTTGSLEVEPLMASFPLIEYSLQWVNHAVGGFKAKDVLQNPLQVDTQDDFYTILAKFINTPLTISVWIEVARTFHMKPSLKSLVALRPNRTSQLAFASPFNTGKLAITLLEELAADLERLDAEFGYLLRQDPSAIWGPSITAFCKSAFWVETDATITTSMLPEEAAGAFRSGSRQRPILVQSQVSSSGDELGIVLVLPPRNYLAAAEAVFGMPAKTSERYAPFLSDEDRQKLVKLCSSGWKVRYQRRHVRNEQVLMDFEVELPESQVCHMLEQCITSRTPHRFPFPVAFSHDLDRLIVLRSVLTIRSVHVPGSEQLVPQCRLQSLDGKAGTRPGVNNSERTAFYSVFSPNSKALAFVFGQLQPKTINCRRVQVWSDAAVDGDWPDYRCRGEVMTSRFAWQKESSYDQFAFHPYLPILVFTEWDTTAAWMFDDVGPKTKRTIFKIALTSLGFTEDGNHLQWRQVSVVSKPDNAYDSNDHPSDAHALADACRSYHPNIKEGLVDLRQEFLSEIFLLNPDRNQSPPQIAASTLTNSNSQSNSTISTITIHQTATQRVTSEVPVTTGSHLLAHLPRLRQGEETHISLLPCAENDKWVCMVWNKSAQDTYSIYDDQTPHLPSVIYRQQGTIEEYSGEDRSVKRRRLE